MRRSLPGLLAVAAAALFAVGIGTAADVQSVLFSSDMLLPSDWVHNLLTAPGTIRSFEWPRVPSLFPDMLGVLLLSLAIPAWRLALLGYEVLSFTALVVLCGAVVAGLAGRRFAPSAAVFGALAAVALLVDVQFDQGLSAFTLILYPVIHSGSVLCLFGALLLVRRHVAAPGRATAVWLVAVVAVATLSDRLFIGLFVVPAVAGALAYGTGRRPDWRPDWQLALRVAGLVAAGCIAGTLIDRALFHTLLVRQPDVGVKLSTVLSRLPGLLRDRYVYIEAACAACAAMVPALWARRLAEGRFWWAAGAAGSVALMGMLPVVYIDWTSYRYVQPVWWWALIALAGLIVRMAPRLGPSLAVATAGLATLAGTWVRPDLFDVAGLARWRYAPELCLAGLRPGGSVHAGLAEYWTARPTAASSDWTLPVAQVLPNGRPFVWGNSRLAYGTGTTGRPIPFDFVLPTNLDPDRLEARFGPPDRRVACGDQAIWLYGDPGHLRSRLVGTDRRTGLASEPISFGPSDLSGPAGPLPRDGTVPEGVATHGPYAALRPGPWRIVLRTTASGTPALWEVRNTAKGAPLASFTVPEGSGRVTSATFDMPDAPRDMELAIRTGAGTRLAVARLGLCPAALDEAACIRATLP